MRAVGLHEDVIAVTSRVFATGCVLVRSGHPLDPSEVRQADAVYDNLEQFTQAWLAADAPWRRLG